ncbi:GlsB/YeaQ/YmgE family stress response membrane protein [uncultured Thiobacillus sp.]|uniref:GlsB/YeaQ/YmgE family stress response membrane protein n=2 Tax=Thiobacillus TaxID=919 RepID=UPI0026066052|nr:GlsB/YeaQ/YmgE family stress response membrane protein [uncultured Thiobacillus sp.]
MLDLNGDGHALTPRNARTRNLNFDPQGRNTMSWIVSLIIGGIVGWLASMVMKTDAQMGWIANVAVGVVGSMLGYWIAGLLGFAAVGGIARFIVAFGGAVLLIFILGKLGIFRKA